MKTIKLKINGIETEAEDRTPILAIAEKLGSGYPPCATTRSWSLMASAGSAR